MKAIVTGATGFLGGHLCSLLAEQGVSVIGFGRNLGKSMHLEGELCQLRQVDITDEHSLNAVFEQADVLFHCAALSSAWGAYDSFYKHNVYGTELILKMCEKYHVKRLVYVSSTSVYFDFKSTLNIKENSALPVKFANHYATSKYQAEELLLAEKVNTEVVILRPRGIIGEGDQAIMPRILAVAGKGFFPLPDAGKALVDITYVKNVAHALYLASVAKNVNGHRINISNKEPLTVRDLLEQVFLKTGRKVKFFNVSYAFIFALASISERCAKVLNLGEPRLTRYGVGLLGKSQTLDISTAETLLGYKPVYSLDHAISQYAQWERATGESK